MKKVKVLLFWLRSSEGGRKHPPTRNRYSTVIRFCDPTQQNSSSAWSVVLDLGELNAICLTMLAEMTFLVERAPVDVLQTGFSFELLEGARVVAKGVVIE